MTGFKESKPAGPTDLTQDFGPDLVRRMMRLLQVDPDGRSGIKETPTRVFAAWQFWLDGYNHDPFEVLKCFEDGAERVDELVFQGCIPFWSMCEHHMAPFFGIAHVGYIPNGKIIGLSKIARVLDILARRLQVQERLTQQVANVLYTGLKTSAGELPLGVGVVLQGRHSCMESRGVQKIGTVTTTSALIGVFKYKPEARAEFMQMVTMASQRGADVL